VFFIYRRKAKSNSGFEDWQLKISVAKISVGLMIPQAGCSARYSSALHNPNHSLEWFCFFYGRKKSFFCFFRIIRVT